MRQTGANQRSKRARYARSPLRPSSSSEVIGDNGRVIGYDNAHGYHHRHAFGRVEAIEFVGFEDIEARFEGDWIALRKKR